MSETSNCVIGGDVLHQGMEDELIDISDNESICSESSIGSDILDNNVIQNVAPQNVNHVNRRRRMVARLGQPQANLP